MSRNSLDARLTALETRMRAELTTLTSADVRRLIGKLRAEGRSEAEVFDRLTEADPNRRLAMPTRPAQYSIHDHPLIRLPDKWAARHEHPFVRLIGQLAEGQLCILTHPDEAHRQVLEVGPEWRGWDVLALPYLALLSWFPEPWRSYWAGEERGSLLDHYVELADARATEFASHHGPETAEEIRVDYRSRIEWILETDTEPDELPWNKEAAA